MVYDQAAVLKAVLEGDKSLNITLSPDDISDVSATVPLEMRVECDCAASKAQAIATMLSWAQPNLDLAASEMMRPARDGSPQKGTIKVKPYVIVGGTGARIKPPVYKEGVEEDPVAVVALLNTALTGNRFFKGATVWTKGKTDCDAVNGPKIILAPTVVQPECHQALHTDTNMAGMALCTFTTADAFANAFDLGSHAGIQTALREKKA